MNDVKKAAVSHKIKKGYLFDQLTKILYVNSNNFSERVLMPMVRDFPPVYNKAKTIVFDKNVTKISPKAFRDFTALKEIKIPKQITEIGTCAFQNCESLTSVIIENENIELRNAYDAFKNCGKITFKVGQKLKGLLTEDQLTFMNCHDAKVIVI